jgi:thiol-disulfide isomerase/thioredoxin
MGIKEAIADNFMIILLAIVAILCVIVFVYYKYMKPKLSPTYVANKEFVDTKNTSALSKKPIAHVMLFTASWCPYCRKLQDEGTFSKFKSENQGKVINNYELDIQEIDCSNDQDSNIKTKLDEYNVDGFPSIKLIKEGDPPSSAYDFDAKPSIETLNQFIHAVL